MKVLDLRWGGLLRSVCIGIARHSGWGGTRDVAILAAVNRRELPAFAHLVTRRNGAVMVAMTLVI